MKTPSSLRRPALVLLAVLFAAGVHAAGDTEIDHAAHHPEAQSEGTEAPADAMQAMRERMRAIRETTDPEARMRLMEEQMAAMEGMRAGGMECPMMGGGMMGGPMMQGGMMGGPMMQGGMGSPGKDDAAILRMRLDAIEKRLDMMQMMMQSQMGGGAMRGGPMGR